MFKALQRTASLKGATFTRQFCYHILIHSGLRPVAATSQLGCPWPQFNRPWKSHNNRQRKMPPEAGIAIGGVIGVIY